MSLDRGYGKGGYAADGCGGEQGGARCDLGGGKGGGGARDAHSEGGGGARAAHDKMQISVVAAVLKVAKRKKVAKVAVAVAIKVKVAAEPSARIVISLDMRSAGMRLPGLKRNAPTRTARSWSIRTPATAPTAASTVQCTTISRGCASPRLTFHLTGSEGAKAVWPLREQCERCPSGQRCRTI